MRHPFIDKLTLEELHHDVVCFMELTRLTPGHCISAILIADNFKDHDWGDFPEDMQALKQIMREHYEWFASVMVLPIMIQHVEHFGDLPNFKHVQEYLAKAIQ